MSKKWLSEIERDLLALGSIIFYFLVVGRALIGPFPVLLSHLLISAFLLSFLFFLYKDFETYLSRTTILIFSLSFHYESFNFTTFAIVVFFLIIFSSYRKGNSKRKIITGITIGLICFWISFLIEKFFLNIH